MKHHIHTLQDTLAFQLQGLLYAEQELKPELEACSSEITSDKIKAAIAIYIENADYKRSRLERIFDYLMQEPEARKNKPLKKLLEETKELLDFTDSPHLRDILMVSCLQNINAYIVSSIKIAYMFTLELELDTASDLLQQMLEWELETGKALSRLAIEEFNKGHALASP
ncbi:MAG: DUF892 family protein [Chryseosolibacter sp.]